MGKEEYRTLQTIMVLIGTLVLAGCLTGCIDDEGKPTLMQTGSSTVLPLAIAWAEEFDGADISVSGGGSSHGLNALLLGEADLGDASRLMKGTDYTNVGGESSDVNADGTAKRAAPTGVWPEKWIVAYDVLVVVINNNNNWSTQLDYTQLYKIFTDDNPAVYWDEIPGLSTAPHEKIEIYAPDEASGTYDFFFEKLIPNWGKDTQQTHTRLDSGDGVYHPSADDNVILNAIRDNTYAIGYFGYAYYKENTQLVQPVWVAEQENDYQEPSLTNVANYSLARPLYIYTNGIPQQGEIINEYLRFILSEDGQSIVTELSYVKLDLVNQNLIADQLAKL